MPSATIRLVIGPARSGKTELLLADYRQALAARRPGACLWLAPTQRSAADIRARLLATSRPAVLGPGVMTFDQLARHVLAGAQEPVRPLSGAMKRHLLRRLVARASDEGTLVALRPIAATPGLVDELAAWIGELKRDEVWPDHLATALATGDGEPHGRELAELYRRYQEHLLEHRLFDAEGQFWTARSLIDAGHLGPLAGTRLVVADGFTDFTHTQHEIIRLLTRSIDELHIALPSDAGRRELFTKTRRTIAQLKRDHPTLVETRLEAPAQSWPAMQAICRRLFDDPRAAPASEPAAGVEIHPAANSVAEIDQIARRIKTLLTTGDDSSGGQPVAADQIAVVFRRGGDAAPLVREVFDEFGIPLAIEAGRPLRDSPLIATLGALVSLAVEDWPFARVLSIVANSYFQAPLAERDEAREAAEWTLRDLQLPRGRAALLRQVDRRVTQTLPNDAGDVLKRRRHRAATAKPWFQWLAALVDALPERADFATWITALDALVDGTAFAGGHTLVSKQRIDPFDRAAWRRTREIILAVGDLAVRLEPGASIDRAGLAALLNDTALREQLPADHDETGRVRVLSAASVRALSVPYLFVADLAEKSFPSLGGESRLCSDVEHRRLIAAGLRLAPRAELAAAEMLLFYEVVTRATHRLYLSYPAWDAAGQPLLPSPYLLEMSRLFGQEQFPQADAPDLSPLPRTDVPRSPREWRLMAVDAALDERPALLAGLARHPAAAATGSNVLCAIESIADRRQRGQFGRRYDGLFFSTAARAAVAARYDERYPWNATDLELVAACPFRFFGERILGLEEMPDLALESDPRRRGSAAHDVLAELHRELNKRAGGPASLASLSADELGQIFERLLTERLAVSDQDASVEAALRLVDRRRLARDLGAYGALHGKYDEQHAALDEPPRAAHFEVSFGLNRGLDDPRSKIDPLVIDTPAGKIKIAGRIDRIDLGRAAGRTVMNVIDYKTGRLPAKKWEDLKKDDHLQLPLYALAGERLLFNDLGASAYAIGYWLTAKRENAHGFHVVGALAVAEAGHLEPSDEWRRLQEWILDRVAQLVLAVRGGQFPMASRDEKCTSYCSLRTVCRVNQARSLEKSWTPPSAPGN